MGITKDLLELMAKAIVDVPDEVDVQEIEGDRSTVLELKVAQSDIGKVVGKQGRIANALRMVVKAAAVKEGKRVNVEILP